MAFQEFLLPILITIFFSSISAIFYYRHYLKRDIAISIILYSLFVFCIVYFVSFEDNLGLGLGLLGILSLIRLRSSVDNLIDIGFIFYSITIGLLNASIQEVLPMIISVNVFLTLMILLLGSGVIFQRNLATTKITFDDLDLDRLADPSYLKGRVKERLRVNVLDLQVENVNYLRDSVTVTVTYERSA